MNIQDGTGPFEISDTLGYNEVYNKIPGQGHYLFKLAQNKGDLVNVFIEATLKITGSATIATRQLVGKYIGAQILKMIRIRTEDSIYQTINPLYMYGRIDDLVGTQAYSRLLNSLETINIALGANTIVYRIPVLSFFNRKNPLVLKNKLPMYIEIMESGQLMSGSTSTLTNSSFRLKVRYQQGYNNISIPSIPKELTIPNIFQEDTVLCSSNTTSASVMLKCPYKVFHIYCWLKNTASFSLKQIEKVELKATNGIIYDMSFEENYICGDPDDVDGFNANSTFSIKIFPRDSNEYRVFSSSSHPCILTVYFSGSVAEYNLETVCEYHNEISKNSVLINSGTFA